MRKDRKKQSLPAGWVWATVEQVCLVNPRAFVAPVSDNCEVSFVPMAAIEAETGVIDLSQTKLFRDVKKGYTKFSDGDVLFAKITPCMENGKFAIANGLKNGSACGTTELHVLRPFLGLSREYLLFFLLQTDFRKHAQRNMAGTAGQLRVPAWFIEEAHIPLPPVPEQLRIVAEIEKQFTRLDAAESALKRAEANLKRYRASVLKAACEGKLVPTEAELAEAEGRDFEHAEQLLERILAERRARRESQDKRRRKYKEPVPPDTSDLPELPEGWVWGNLDQLADVGTGSTPLTTEQEYYQGGHIPWVTSSALNNPLISTPTKFVTDRAVRECRLTLYPPHTLLVAMYGEGKTRGKCSELVFESTINQAIAAITLPPVGADSRSYIRLSLASRYEDTRRLAKGGVQPNLNLGIVRQITIPLPPLAEQQRVVAELERQLSVIQQAETSVLSSLRRAKRLRQSVLKLAFSGRLVHQDPNDEPASVLIERIAAERSAAQTKTHRKRKTRRRRSKSASDGQLRLLENGE